MTFEMYKSIQDSTNKAEKYLRGKDCLTIGTWVIIGEYRVVGFNVANASDAMVKHVKKQYPTAIIRFVDEMVIENERNTRISAYNEYVSK